MIDGRWSGIGLNFQLNSTTATIATATLATTATQTNLNLWYDIDEEVVVVDLRVHALRAIAPDRAGDQADAVLVACFDDTGVDALRCLLDAPVIGIGEAAYHAASMIAAKFSVVTTLSRSVPGLEANLVRYGLAQKCSGVRATDIPVLELENGNPDTTDTIRAEIRKAIAEDGAEAIVLGCAGMADLMARLSDEFGLPVIDGVACGVTMAEALVKAGLKTSKINAYSIS